VLRHAIGGTAPAASTRHTRLQEAEGIIVFVRVCKSANLSEGEVIRFAPDGAEEAIAVCHSDGEFFAIADKCSHGNWSLSEGFLENCHLECVLHGSAFDLKTGWPNKLPATKPVKIYDVKVEDGDVFVDVSSGRITQPDEDNFAASQ
jgi:nitrite reductase/ring-hydroxylating ferredoxin subunit